MTRAGSSYARDVRGEKNPNFKHGGYVDERRYRELVDLGAPCAFCGCQPSPVVVHHKNGDHEDDRPENLAVSCNPCHSRHHRIEEGSRKAGRWALAHDACARCGRTDRPHAGRGLCVACFVSKHHPCADCPVLVGRYQSRCRACNMRRVRRGGP